MSHLTSFICSEFKQFAEMKCVVTLARLCSFKVKKTNMHTYFYIKWLCVCLTFPLQSAIWCGMISDDVWMHADDARFILWPVTLLESYFQWWGFAYTFLLAGVHQFLGEGRDFLGISFLKQIHWRLFMHQGHSYSRMWVCGVCFM